MLLGIIYDLCFLGFLSKSRTLRPLTSVESSTEGAPRELMRCVVCKSARVLVFFFFFNGFHLKCCRCQLSCLVSEFVGFVGSTNGYKYSVFAVT